MKWGYFMLQVWFGRDGPRRENLEIAIVEWSILPQKEADASKSVNFGV